jgi:TolB-like protein/class 3 adenylate cyclase/Tfp pilus assembly protein PilF
MGDIHLRRRLTAVLLADVVGYSRLMSIDEEATHLRLADYVKSLIDPAVAKHRGRLIRSMGDGMLVEFDSALDAVRCGIEIQRGLAAHEGAVDPERRIQLRIGINTGDVIVDERDIYGNSINIAARLEGLAEPGQIYVTRGVRDQLRGYPSLSFEDKGERRVKNIDRPIRVFRVEYDQEGPPRTSSRGLAATVRRLYRTGFRRNSRSALLVGALAAIAAILAVAAPPLLRDGPPPPPRNSIVVLPFSNFSGDKEQGYVADAITDDLTTDLARLKGTFVIARDTAFTFKGRSVDAREIGKECGVRYLLEGSIRRAGTRVETNVQLIDAKSGGHIWADHFDSNMADLFALQAAVTGRIAASLDIQLIKAEGQRMLEQPTANPDALDLRFRAMAIYISGINPDHTLEGRRLLEQSVRLDPSSAESWAWLADLLASDYLNRWNGAGKAQLDQADDAVRKALAIDPDLALAHFVKGFVYRARGENPAALDAFSQALRLNPNFTRAYAQKANELINVGRPTEAPPLVMRAIELSPLDPSIGVFYWIIGRANFFAGDYADAIDWLQRSVEARPNLWYNRLYLVAAYALSDHTADARKALSEFNNRFHNYTLARVISHEQDIPNNNPVVATGLGKLHDALRAAGMAEQ